DAGRDARSAARIAPEATASSAGTAPPHPSSRRRSSAGVKGRRLRARKASLSDTKHRVRGGESIVRFMRRRWRAWEKFWAGPARLRLKAIDRAARRLPAEGRRVREWAAFAVFRSGWIRSANV